MRPLASVIAAGLLAAGCSSPSGTTSSVATARSEGHGHSHTRDKMRAADAGKYHAWLTSHLSSKDGNELDIFFETGEDKDPKPVALPVEKFTAKAKKQGDDKEYELVFEPAPADERPKDEAPGTCSHFVAKAPWMSAGDVLTVTAEVPIDGQVRKPTWPKFDVRKYAHHIE